MTDPFDPRSPFPATSYADVLAHDDDPYDDPDYDPRRDDPGAWENYLPGGSMYDAGDDPGAAVADDSAPAADASAAHPAPDNATDDSPEDATEDFAAMMEARSPRALLAQLPPLPTLGSQRAGGRQWCAARRVAFLQMLSASQCVVAAARSVGMSRSGAYRLRGRLPESAFVRAWDRAFAHGYDALAHAALDRALNGVPVPHYYKGELVGTSRRYDERLTMGLLSARGAILHGASSPAWREDGEWELLLHTVVDEAAAELNPPPAGADEEEESARAGEAEAGNGKARGE